MVGENYLNLTRTRRQNLKSTKLLNKEILSPSIPTLSPTDTVNQALELMGTYHLSHLPVVEQDKYLGLALEDDLLNINGEDLLIHSVQHMSKVAVQAGTHFLEAVQAVNDYDLSVVPVLERDGLYLGMITGADLLIHLGKITGASVPGAVIVLELEKQNFSFSEVSKLVETNDAHITQLNTYWDDQNEAFFVTIKINKFEVSDIIATFQRYEYQVKYYFGEELYENELRSNYDNLINYLNI